METAAAKNSRQCPSCGVKLTRYEWSKLWWISGPMSGRLVQPCTECGAKLRMSSMAVISSFASVGLILTAVCFFFLPDFWPDSPAYLSVIAVVLLLVILFAMMATRIESVPSPTAPLEPPPERVGKKRL